MRLMIVGQKWLGAELFRQCMSAGHDIAAVAAPGAVGEDYDRLYAAAQQLGVPALVVGRRLDAGAVPDGVDLILAAHARAFIPRAARERARLGVLGYHPSLLPRHRGRDAVHWAIHMRETVTGGTLYWLDDGADTGPIALQDWCHIRPEDTPASLWRRELGPMGLRLFAAALAMIEEGECRQLAQDPALATWEPAFHSKPLAAAV
ncbi:formyltransferase family protein [Burkholderia ubonensis]|uniref:formyltransferase family protein n=1 Tax=Burkholderia ubonensis TaxID=101571 RepID=UPI0007576AEC|nr:formyltransferase family protein [Burkholderia ubonensis]KVG24748.1 methionyl-tRNA formyltransferase [Burkholderia ubonensis]OJA62501.1 methionyl-tRNA formyltransferase [Burkholderia ubonensis]